MPTTKIVILGAGGHARDVLDVLEACNEESARYEMLGFVVEAGHGQAGAIVNGLPILGDLGWLAQHADDSRLIAAVGSPALRLHLVEAARARGGRFAETVVHPSVIRTKRITMGEGAVVGAGVTMTSLIRLGRHAHVNNGSTIAHDVVIGDYATVSPGTHLSGNVDIGEGTYVGTGASVIEKIRIGAWSIVGAGSAVIRDVPANVTAVGCPAAVIKERPAGWQRR
jgi:sugar O-acyltransferase (sialic acid O-acetyltransferase NeuD family)